MRLRRIHIENYKSFEDVALSDLSNINMIYGYNNTGKSNVLKFLALIFSPKEDPEKAAGGVTPNFWKGIIKDSPFIFKDNKTKKDILFEISLEILKNELGIFNEKEYKELEKIYFKNNHKYVTLKINGKITYLDFYHSEIKLTTVLLNGKEIFKYDEVEPYFQSSPIKSVVRSNGYSFFNTIMGQLNNCVQFLDNDRFFIAEKVQKKGFSIDQLSSKKIKNWFYQMSLLPEHYEIFKDSLEFISGFDTKASSINEFENIEKNSPLKRSGLSFSIKNGEVEMILQNQIGNRLPISSYGTGIQQIFYILTKILLVEELELNLSPKYQTILLKNLLKMIDNKKISQVVFTTHSKYFKFRNDFRIYEVNIDGLGNTSINRVKAVTNKFFEPDDIV